MPPRATLLRIPYTEPLPAPRIIPASVTSTARAVDALVEFLTPSLPGYQPWKHATTSSPPWRQHDANGSSSRRNSGRTVLLTGAGISVASGLADYRGTNGTYTLNKTYRPIYFHEFCENHEARKRYWARSFLGWTNLHQAQPNQAHLACGELGRMGIVQSVITQNVDSLHPNAHPHLPTTELHGYLRALVCRTCGSEYSRRAFQEQLATLNPTWASFLAEMLACGALDTEHPDERRQKGLRTNPDGDVHVPDAPYPTFRYPACPVCAEKPPHQADGRAVKIVTDQDGAWHPASHGGVLKPAVVMFGESIPAATKEAVEVAVDGAERILVLGSSLATYSAWRLVKRAKESRMPIGIVNIGGVRGEDGFFGEEDNESTGREAVRVSEMVDKVLPEVVGRLKHVQSSI